MMKMKIRNTKKGFFTVKLALLAIMVCCLTACGDEGEQEIESLEEYSVALEVADEEIESTVDEETEVTESIAAGESNSEEETAVEENSIVETSSEDIVSVVQEETSVVEEPVPTVEEAPVVESQAAEPDVQEVVSEAVQTEQQIAAETSAPEPVQEAAVDNTMVWQSETGSKYHSINNCGRMNPNKAIQITKTEAINRGLGQCSKCW